MAQTMTNRQLRAQETRKKILAAAKALIAKQGFAQTSIEEIAKQAGVSTGSFYTYFKKKEDVVEALSQTDFYRLAEIVCAMEHADILERLRYYCRAFLGDIEETGIEICRQWLRNNLAPTEMPIGGEMIPKYQFDDRAVRTVLEEAVRVGQLRADTPVDELALLLNAHLYGLMVVWCMTDSQVIGSEQVDTFCDTALKATLAPYRNK